MGTAGYGFIFDLALFSALLLFPAPTWVQVVGILLIAHTWYVCFTIIRKHNEEDPLLNKIANALRQGQDADT